MTRDLAEPAPRPMVSLSYEPLPPAGGGDARMDELANGDVMIDLPPLARSVFTTMLVIWALCAGMVTLILTQLRDEPASVATAWFTASLAAVCGAYWLYLLARYRGARQIVRIEAGTLSYANTTTRRVLTPLSPHQCRRVRVRPCWWGPWTVQAHAELDVSFWTMRATAKPVILLIDSNRMRLERCAAMLRRALHSKTR